ncbi:MAG: asparagine synthase (glutamine-hydrolyzing) [Patescibacteria group bacterium]|nr:asparagine synthase (glutamine-hydrolyzing) [Patescibacteria group bacterium]
MCGIVGIFYHRNNSSVDESALIKARDTMVHRGPDDAGIYISSNKILGLGHRRLSIIDLSPAGHQPMANKDETSWITFNGEIYNFIEIREELEKIGHQFKSNSDTEVVLHAYEEWGEECLNKFNGMWAFAIWDNKKQELFCSRDRFGVKPFYYYYDNQKIIFGSEIKAILEYDIHREPNDKLIYDFLKFGILDHTDETFFKDIKKLPAASWLKIKQNGQITIKKYWDFEISDEIDADSKINRKKNVQEFLDLFVNSVKLRLRSDVPVGSCLSGGLDSSSIVCVINNLLKKEKIPNIKERQKTFSSCFKDKRFDEREYIEEIIKNTGAEKKYIFPEPEEFLKELDHLIWHQEEPFGGTSIYAQWKVIETAGKEVKVLLDGQGGDENLCGYRKFYIFYLRKLLQNHRYFSFINESVRFFSSIKILKTLNIKSGLKYFGLGNNLQKADNLFNPEFLKKFKDEKIIFGYQNNLGKRIKEDLTTWSLPALLRYEDKNSMAHSVEARVPFLDYRLVEKTGSLPLSFKMRNGWTKMILREAMKNILPDKIRLRKSKLGFVTPEENWFKEILKKEIESAIKNGHFISNYINKNNLTREFIKFSSGKSFLPALIFFRFYILELWGEKFILNKKKL